MSQKLADLSMFPDRPKPFKHKKSGKPSAESAGKRIMVKWGKLHIFVKEITVKHRSNGNLTNEHHLWSPEIVLLGSVQRL